MSNNSLSTGGKVAPVGRIIKSRLQNGDDLNIIVRLSTDSSIIEMTQKLNKEIVSF